MFTSAFASHHQQDSLVINQIADVDKAILFQKVVLPFPRGPCNFIQFGLADFIFSVCYWDLLGLAGTISLL